jgi:TatA/E family protein of Tat protein translocase
LASILRERDLPGLLEILIIVVLALLLFGYKRIPVLGRSLGKGASEFGKSFREAANLAGCVQEKEDSRKQSNDG